MRMPSRWLPLAPVLQAGLPEGPRWSNCVGRERMDIGEAEGAVVPIHSPLCPPLSLHSIRLALPPQRAPRLFLPRGSKIHTTARSRRSAALSTRSR